MPRRDGIRTIPHLRAACPHVGIVMHSAESGRTEDALDLGADVWHTKGDPVTAVLDSAAMVGALARLSARTGDSTLPRSYG
ncbi:MAG: hypothetical protein KY437_11240 [Actinobacteria bacterium]|nr:hypothetical protein [Actinomycetota bacterium]